MKFSPHAPLYQSFMSLDAPLIQHKVITSAMYLKQRGRGMFDGGQRLKHIISDDEDRHHNCILILICFFNIQGQDTNLVYQHTCR